MGNAATAKMRLEDEADQLTHVADQRPDLIMFGHLRGARPERAIFRRAV
jgi:hypothetical protein